MIYLNDIGIVNALGFDQEQVYSRLIAGESPGMLKIESPIYQREFFAGQVLEQLPSIPSQFDRFNCRNNQLVLAALEQIKSKIETAKIKYGAQRIGVVLGTSTSGIAEAELALQAQLKTGEIPQDYDYKKQEIGSISEFVAAYMGLEGPAYTVSTACSSSGKVFASAEELINLDICDFVVVGGADSLCELTLSGFASLEAISNELTNPFSINRKGINIGEAAALFTMSRERSPVALFGVGESSDAHHMSAPEPSGEGAKSAMLSALKAANLTASDINYINLHGTGTKLNDAMESHAVYSLFADKTPASSTKPFTGHTLGAAGATEAAICWLLLFHAEKKRVAIHQYDGQSDPELSNIHLVTDTQVEKPIQFTLSNSFAFGGNNVSVILGRAD